MKTIKIKTELKDWLIDNITNTIHGLEAENSDEFNNWAKVFKREEAEFVVNMEFGNDWGMIPVMKLPKKKLLNMLNQF